MSFLSASRQNDFLPTAVTKTHGKKQAQDKIGLCRELSCFAVSFI
jgi:hypothetical protein